uniref:OBP6 n=1 Tax=Corythucha ciliata TaxID=369451 RepID=A0A3G2YUW2_CORCT|nr:OBP6 [Corythucha ciliata]
MNSFALLGFVAALVAVSVADPISTVAPGSTTASKLTSGAAKAADEMRIKIKQQVDALTEQCKTQVKLTPEQAKIVSNQAIPKTEPEKCFLECLYNGLQLTKDNKFNEQAARALAQKRFSTSPDELAKANTMIDACAKEVVVKDTNEKCVMGRLVRECFVKNGAKINFFPKA